MLYNPREIRDLRYTGMRTQKVPGREAADSRSKHAGDTHASRGTGYGQRQKGESTVIEGIIRAVCTSPEKGTEKTNVHSASFRTDWGIEGDAHAGPWHRQVSLLSYQKVQAFNLQGACVSDGAFGENLLVDGIDCASLPVGTILRCGTVALQVTQIGKECHQACAIRRRVGTCIMPHQGIFARVLSGGTIREGDRITAYENGTDEKDVSESGVVQKAAE